MQTASKPRLMAMIDGRVVAAIKSDCISRHSVERRRDPQQAVTSCRDYRGPGGTSACCRYGRWKPYAADFRGYPGRCRRHQCQSSWDVLVIAQIART